LLWRAIQRLLGRRGLKEPMVPVWVALDALARERANRNVKAARKRHAEKPRGTLPHSSDIWT
jgi:allophanate hydrolase subunit 2